MLSMVSRDYENVFTSSMFTMRLCHWIYEFGFVVFRCHSTFVYSGRMTIYGDSVSTPTLLFIPHGQDRWNPSMRVITPTSSLNKPHHWWNTTGKLFETSQLGEWHIWGSSVLNSWISIMMEGVCMGSRWVIQPWKVGGGTMVSIVQHNCELLPFVPLLCASVYLLWSQACCSCVMGFVKLWASFRDSMRCSLHECLWWPHTMVLMWLATAMGWCALPFAVVGGTWILRNVCLYYLRVCKIILMHGVGF